MSREKFAAVLLKFMLAFLCFLPIAGFPLTVLADTGEGSKLSSEQKNDKILEEYKEYCSRLDAVAYRADIEACGFRIIESQIFPIELSGLGEVSLIPAFDTKYDRLLLFFVKSDGTVVYKTDQLETNTRSRGMLQQPNKGIAAISFQDVNGNGLMDIVLITNCINESGAYAGKTYKVGDVLFQGSSETGFYRDYRISDKINRFGMNKSVEFITAFVRDGYSTEFLYTSGTLDELLANGLKIITEQCYTRNFEKLGRLQVVPGTYRIADYDVFMIFLVNEQGYIVSSLQPMGDFDNLYALKGINCRDIDGDGLRDIIVLARYSYEGSGHELIVKSDYAVYYQRTGGFSADLAIKEQYPCSDEDTMEALVEKARAYWGWRVENDKATDS